MCCEGGIIPIAPRENCHALVRLTDFPSRSAAESGYGLDRCGLQNGVLVSTATKVLTQIIRQIMNQAIRSVVVLTGAGISAESGIKTFRAADGLWENHPIEEVATPEGFARNPQLVYEFYNGRRRQLLSGEVRPNPAHTALAKLEHEFPGEFLLVTQNVDNLHERAGSRKLLHMHGELLKMRCINTDLVYECRSDIDFDIECKCCREPGNLRPHIVWFGEMPFYMGQITQALMSCDLFISMLFNSCFVQLVSLNPRDR